jgi:ABC-type sugar transport system ATPase subunit
MAYEFRASHLTKHYGSTTALDDVSFDLGEGEVVAVAGENGAGKSTLTQILAGVIRPDRGSLSINGGQVVFKGASDAIAHGISTVFQELSLVGNLSVAENIFPDRQPTRFRGLIRWKALRDDAQALMRQFGLDLDPRELTKNLSVGKLQILEILKAISVRPRILLLDEPTSSLSDADVQLLFGVIRKLKAQGVSIVLVTHRLQEIFDICDRVIVLRDGRLVDDLPIERVTEPALVKLMIGREIRDIYPETHDRARSGTEGGKTLFEVDGLSGEGYENVSFVLREGELLGLAGLVGSGRTELARGIVHADPTLGGHITLGGSEVKPKSVRDAIDKGIGYLTEDRKDLGLYLSLDIEHNLVANRLDDFSNRGGVLSRSAIRKYANETIRRYGIAAASSRQEVGSLSGGNQQKVLLSTWLAAEPSVIFLDEPTRGVDVGARAEIYAKIVDYARSGHGVVIISSELPELIGLCDRILVMRAGSLAGELLRDEFSEEAIMTLATGVVRGGVE